MTIFIFLINSAALIKQTFAAEKLNINTGDAPPLHKPDQSGFIDSILHQAFSRIGHEITINYLPAERSLQNANAGIDDGDSDRIAGLERIYPNLMAVPESIMDWEFVAFSKQSNIQLSSWRDIKPYSIAYITGWKIFERNTEDIRVVTPVDDVHQLFSLIINDRSDIALYEKWQGLSHLHKQKRNDVFVLSSPLAIKPKFLYLHKKHHKLIPQLAEALKIMKNDGSYQKIYGKVLEPLLINP